MQNEVVAVTGSSILFGFLFTGFWWALDRELKFEPQERHFKLGYLLLFVTMAILAIFGVLRPLAVLLAASGSQSALAGVAAAMDRGPHLPS